MAIKTLHLTNWYHATSGGIRTFYRALLARATEEQRLFRLVVPGPEEDVENVSRFCRIFTLKAPLAPAFDRRYRLILPGAYLRRAGTVRAILAAEQPDLVEICDKYSLCHLAGMLRKEWMANIQRPTLVALSCERMDDNVAAYLTKGSLARAGARQYIRYIYGPQFDFHVANSEYTAEELRRNLWDRAPDFVQVCPMGVDYHTFGPERRDVAFRERLLRDAGGGPHSTLLLYAGRISPEKNIPLLIDLLGRLGQFQEPPANDYRLLLVGDGPLVKAVLDDAARRAPGRVQWIGAVRDRRMLARIYASADVFVHPNPREPFGIGPLEAMASHIPVVAPSAGGVVTYANARNAWMATPDAASFAVAVDAAANQPDPAKLDLARRTARELDWSTVAGRYFRLYDEFHRRRLWARSPQTDRSLPEPQPEAFWS